MNRRLRKLAVWSDERVEFRKINATEKRRKLDQAYKNMPQTNSTVTFASYPRTPLTESGFYTDDQGKEATDPYHGHRLKANARYSMGSMKNYSDHFMKRIQEGERSGSSVVNFRQPAIASKPAVGVNIAGDTEAIGARFKQSVANGHKFITKEETRGRNELSEKQKAKRKREDNDYRYKRLKELGLI